MNPDLSTLADLVDAFAAAQDAYLAEHAIAYDSLACHSAYDRLETVRDALDEEIDTVLHRAPKILSAALRSSNQGETRYPDDQIC